MTINETDIFLRLILAAVLGICIGLERERKGQPAGLRTNTILSIGSALAMVLSINLAGKAYDPTRLAAQVVSGIGFLGAGAILRYGMNVKGLTTAATLWTMAIVGMAVGAGYYLVSVVTTAILLLTLVGLNIVEHRFITSMTMITVNITAKFRKNLTNDIEKVIVQKTRSISAKSYTMDNEVDQMVASLTIKTTTREDVEELLEALAQVKGVKKVEIS
jgi:putative Mg2+ transporter-C (MgtC) family protein